MNIKIIVLLLGLLIANVHSIAHSEETHFKKFQQGSYQQLLNHYKNKPFVLIIWSITCSPCLKEMAFISTLHQQQPKLNLILLTVDDLSANAEINHILTKYNLIDLENWGFFEGHAAKLRFEIDPNWYGELPRTYFFDKHHQRTAISGLISEEKYKQLLAL
ncbi:MAG: hypothetical protein Q9M50_13985 [Methylococcales bacterium]|nr:hypothetical protein [Methylococcales bacterium]